MTAHATSPELDRHARACYRAAERGVSARTVAELNRRRIAACAAAGAGACWRPRRFGWRLASALGSACALALGLAVCWPPSPPAYVPTSIAAQDAADVLDALETINLTALDEDSDFFFWLAAQDASLLAME